MSRYADAHKNLQGPGDARPTARQIVEDEGLVGGLVGKTIFITGANQGIGLETARALYATGATVYLGVRDLAKGQKAIDDITASSTELTQKGALRLVEMSLDSLDSVRKGAKDFIEQSGGKLNILVLNAGIMASTKSKTAYGYESQFATNHLGHFLLFQLVKPALLASTTPELNSRVVAVSSVAHRASEIRFHDYNFDDEGSFEPFASYGQSKTANIYLSNEIERRYGAQGLHSLSLHPGSILTNMSAAQVVDVEATKAMMGEENFQNLMRTLKSTEQGAATSVFAALSKEWEGRGGRYLTDCAEVGPGAPGYNPMSSDLGYAPWAYDQDKAARLWVESCKMVAFEDDA
ncbi:hypothetical protein EsH8_IV_000335 [Colletotrichum jinshuiense]